MDIVAARDLSIDITNQAGIILRNYFLTQDFKQAKKGTAGDIVTQADKEVDLYVKQKLSEKFPGIYIMSEETTSGDYRYLKEKEWIFIVDPLDGTINFTRSIAHFGIAIGLLHKGTMKMCVANLPMRDETYWADEETDGAYLNERRISVSQVSTMNEMVIACGWSNNLKARSKMVKILDKLTQETRMIKSLGSPVADLCLVAKGDLDGYIHPRLRPWDITPAYIVEKAGGIVNNFKRQSWDIFRVDIIASNTKLNKELKNFVPFASSVEIT